MYEMTWKSFEEYTVYGRKIKRIIEEGKIIADTYEEMIEEMRKTVGMKCDIEFREIK